MILGAILAFVGIFLFFVVGSFSGYTDAVIWIVGICLVTIGLITAKSVALINFLNDITRF